jgi:Na+/H+ antiporter NhaD/arsenite permease-like protein
VKGEATPLANVVFLGVGAVLANILGTTGASMLLIRPWIRMNKYRVTAYHIVFFIFIVSNVGGCLTPIGDPPLFLGYLKGVPFWWTFEYCWPMWAVGVGIMLGIFFAVDYRNYLRAPRAVREKLAEPPDRWRFEGLPNLVFLALILMAVFIAKPILLREAIMFAAALGSYYTTRKPVHQANDFNFHPIQEVAILFVGIFATMMPALDWLQINAGKMGNPSVSLFYWGSGLLSSVLDNAPTYLSFLKAIIGAMLDQEIVEKTYQLVQAGGTATGVHAEQINQTLQVLQKYHPAQLMNKSITREEIETASLLGSFALNKCLLAISVGAVFFGACTYIGNGPNFMVKSIAHHNHVNTPSFLGYVFKYTLPFMAPMLVVVWWLFFS